ncbi:MAG: DNA-directed RNA polymerase subunit E'' [Candidatus Caldarchaeum sp.]|nr:DNA-directed RNA polymerase subunit E'' [Candidatus Caldarchaeum sp.]MDW7978495.1 transcription elongation factor subunit Spt4 [Candidatus Caldarchaeum sp.]MDW8359403.1 transcription elongation factor subunit Spt4 [Candidatus Caldarchaeum sp.]
MSARPKACRNCRRIVAGNVCDVCGSSNLSSSHSGLLIILDVEKSQIARELGIRKPGRYAVKVD